MIKACTKCDLYIDICNFSLNKNTLDGLQPHCKDCVSKYKREYRKKNINVIKHIEKNCTRRKYTTYKSSAKKKGRTFTLSREEVEDLVKGNCYYCDEVPDTLNGIDRVINEIGYEPNNCVSCCTKCNFAKGTLGYSEFLDLIKRIYSNCIIEETEYEEID